MVSQSSVNITRSRSLRVVEVPNCPSLSFLQYELLIKSWPIKIKHNKE